jgi:hypothetical protein
MNSRRMSHGGVATVVTCTLTGPAVGGVFYDTTNGLDQGVLNAAPGLSNFGGDPDPHDLLYGQTVSIGGTYALESISVGLKATSDPGPLRLYIFDVGSESTPGAGAVAAYTQEIDTSGMNWNGYRQYYTFTLSSAFTMTASTNYTIAFSSGSPAGTLKWYTSDRTVGEWVKGTYSVDAGTNFTISNAHYSMQLAGSTPAVPGAAGVVMFGGVALGRRRRRR